MNQTAPAGKIPVYLNEYNVLSGTSVYLPLVSGLLRASAEADPLLKERYRFMPFLFYRDSVEDILARYTQEPGVVAFSVSLWNEQLCLAVAAEVKKRFPECLTIFGGPQVPRDARKYLESHPCVDVAVRGEGEEIFPLLLHCFLESRDFGTLPNLTWRSLASGQVLYNSAALPLETDLDRYPSPYLSGLFEELMAAHPHFEFQAIIETNRGCPFGCGYCFWGKGDAQLKLRSHSTDRVKQELSWCARQRIKYLFNADANYGMFQRDMELAQHLVELKATHGYPEKFRACYTKNAETMIFSLGKLLCQNGLDKGITLSFQSLNPEALKNVNRHNIKLEVYRNLIRRFNAEKIPVYTELILGLPGETYDSWLSGISQIIRSRLNGQLFIYLCEVYPNTDLSDPDFRERHRLETVRTELTEIHGSFRDEESVAEQLEIVVGSYSMTREEWKSMLALSWTTLLLLSMKMGHFVLEYLDHRLGLDPVRLIEAICRGDHSMRPLFRALNREFEATIARILSGAGKGCLAPEYGAIYWDLEEYLFLTLNGDLEQFYRELGEIVRELIGPLKSEVTWEEIEEVLAYQRLRLPLQQGPARRERHFSYNIPEFFAALDSGAAIPMSRTEQLAQVHSPGARSKEEFARDTVLWGRKSNGIVLPITWSAAPHQSQEVFYDQLLA